MTRHTSLHSLFAVATLLTACGADDIAASSMSGGDTDASVTAATSPASSSAATAMPNDDGATATAGADGSMSDGMETGSTPDMGTQVPQPVGAPRLFFSDIEGGPSTGGEGRGGAYVTLYGANIGQAPAVSVGTGSAAIVHGPEPYLWYERVVVQLEADATTGDIVLANELGESNPLPFTVRTGTIRFVGAEDGDVSSIAACLELMDPGDICYARAGADATGTQEYGASVLLGAPGQPDAPRALLVYPGASVTIGSEDQGRGVSACSGLSACADGSYWVVGGFDVIAAEGLLAVGVHDIRFVGIDLTCPNGDGSTGCFESSTLEYGKLLGIHVHDAGVPGADKTYHSIYFSTDSNHIEVGWSHVHGGGACRGIQFHSTGGDDQHDLSVHDNLIHDTVCNGINFASVDPGVGVVEAFNNVIYRAGTGPDPGGGPSDYSCILVGSFGSPTSGSVHLFHNTLHECGTIGGSDAGMVTLQRAATMNDNIVVTSEGIPYITDSTAGNIATMLDGSNNLWSGGDPPLAGDGNVQGDPKFVSAPLRDYHLQAGSPAIDAGTGHPGVPWDFDGNTRPQGAGADIGALEAPR